MQLVLILVMLCFISRTVLAQTPNDVDSYVKAIDNDVSLDTLQLARFDESTEGTEILGFYSKGKVLLKIRSTVYGEMGRIATTYYVKSDSLVFQKQLYFEYDAPIYVKDRKTTTHRDEANCLKNRTKCDFQKYRKELQFVKKAASELVDKH